MNVLEIATKLHTDADEIVYGRGLDALLRAYGRVWYTGSYATNLMVWPDIDVHMVMEPDPRSLDRFFDMGRKIAHIDGITHLHFGNQIARPVAGFPKGYYWGIRVHVGSWKTPWKIDLWATDTNDFVANKEWIERVCQALDEDTRRFIIEFKHSLLTSSGRTPMGSGYAVCEGVLFRGLRTDDVLRDYLRQCNIEGI